jgi:hypothetical protein
MNDLPNRPKFDPARWSMSASFTLQPRTTTTQHDPWWARPMNSQSARCARAKQIIEHCKIARIIETGTFFGTTTEFFAAFGLPVVTVEINPGLAARSRERLTTFKNVELRGTDSISAMQELVHDRSDHSAPTLFYLDAHWEKHLPLREEVVLAVSHFPKAVLMIDDFKVPDDPGYGFDDYGPGKRARYRLFAFVDAAGMRRCGGESRNRCHFG